VIEYETEGTAVTDQILSRLRRLGVAQKLGWRRRRRLLLMIKK
jgi:hypothetical protein